MGNCFGKCIGSCFIPCFGMHEKRNDKKKNKSDIPLWKMYQEIERNKSINSIIDDKQDKTKKDNKSV